MPTATAPLSLVSYSVYPLLRDALHFNERDAAEAAALLYYEDTGRRATCVTFPSSLGKACHVLKDGTQYVGRNRLVTYNFPGRPPITTKHEPITAGDYRLGRMGRNVVRVWCHNDYRVMADLDPWELVSEALPRLKNGKVGLLCLDEITGAEVAHVHPEYVLFGERG